jgi:hypothetical protein
MEFSHTFDDQTPIEFTNVQFTPDAMPFFNTKLGYPLSMPQLQLFGNRAQDFGMLGGDPLAPTIQNLNWQHFPTLQTFQRVRNNWSLGPAESFATSSFGDEPLPELASAVSAGASINPSMLFDFVDPDMTTSFASMPQEMIKRVTDTQQYQQQEREAQQKKHIPRKKTRRLPQDNSEQSSIVVEGNRPKLAPKSTRVETYKTRENSSRPRTKSKRPLLSIPKARTSQKRLIINSKGQAHIQTVLTNNEGKLIHHSAGCRYPVRWNEGDARDALREVIVRRQQKASESAILLGAHEPALVWSGLA